MMAAILGISLFILAYTWLGYPCLLLVLSALRRGARGAKEDPDFAVPVTVLLTVRNEEEVIEERLRNILATTFPGSLLEVLVASDGSCDRTNAIVEGIGQREHRIRLLPLDGGGKSHAQNRAIPETSGEIVVLTDAAAHFQPDTISKLVAPFADPGVGCTSGKVVLGEGDSGVAGSQGLYWRYEMRLRSLESSVHVFHTASGQVMAFKKSAFRPFESEYGDDCVIPLDILSRGLRVVHVDDAVAVDTFPSSPEGEIKARKRMTLRNITCTFNRLRFLHPLRHPLVSVAVLSHKVLRWLTPFFMAILVVSNGVLLGRGWHFGALMSAQVLFYGLAVAGYVAERHKQRVPVASQVFSFMLANIGFFLGVIGAMSGKNITSYQNRPKSL